MSCQHCKPRDLSVGVFAASDILSIFLPEDLDRDMKRRCKIQICNPTYSKNLNSFLILLGCLKCAGFVCLFSTLKFFTCSKFSLNNVHFHFPWRVTQLLLGGSGVLHCRTPSHLPEWSFCRRTIKIWWFKSWNVTPVSSVMVGWECTGPMSWDTLGNKVPIASAKVPSCSKDVPQAVSYISKLGFIP